MDSHFFASANKEFGLFQNKEIFEQPNFMNMILPHDVIDPSDNYNSFPSHIYNELPNDLFQHYLDKIINYTKIKESQRKVGQIFYDESKFTLNNYTEYDHHSFQLKNDVFFIKMLNILLDISLLSTKWNYELKSYYISEVKKENDTPLFYCNIKVCIQQPSRAFGKVIKIEMLYHSYRREIKVINCHLFGIVPQEYIKPMMGLLPEKNDYLRFSRINKQNKII